MVRALSFWAWVERRAKHSREHRALVTLMNNAYDAGWPAPRAHELLTGWARLCGRRGHERTMRRSLASWQRYRQRQRERVVYEALVADRAAQARALGLGA